MSCEFCLILVLMISTSSCQDAALPAKVSPAVIPGQSNGACPSTDAQKDATKEEIRTVLGEVVIPFLDAQPQCACSGPGRWTRIAYLNMSDPSQQCPANWNLNTAQIRGCGRSSTAAQVCDSAFFPSNGQSYTRVCGRVIAYQRGSTDAFRPSILGNPTLEDAYVDGVSLTHGAVGSRQHIWTFASALYETDPNIMPKYICSCTNTDVAWPFQVPSFIENNYFCDTGSTGPGFDGSTIYSSDPLWDGAGCGPTNECCALNTPPWFCTTIEPTTDDIELRNCQDEGGEDVLISLVDIYIM